MPLAKRSDENPILVPRSEELWEAQGVFNGCPATDGKAVHFVYRANSSPQDVGGVHMSLSTIGYASSRDGVHFGRRRQLITPEHPWEQFGCEDPRVTRIGSDYYIFYTALGGYPFGPDNIKVAVAKTRDFKKITERHLVTPFNAKAMVLFPEKIDGKFAALLTVNTDRPPTQIALALFEREEDIWSPEYWKIWYESLSSHSLTLRRSLQDHIEVGAPPVKTKHGWLFIYSYIQNYFSPPATFGVEAVLLDLHNPLSILARTTAPILVPQEEYEHYGAVQNIVFPSGAYVDERKLNIYYGAADTVCALATISLSGLVDEMLAKRSQTLELQRSPRNPILRPIEKNDWEAKAVFNPGVLRVGDTTHLLYRAVSPDNTSVFGYASTKDGETITERLETPVYVPRAEFEQKRVPGGNSGCEDPRLTLIHDTVYLLYTAFDGEHPPRVAVSSILLNDFVAKQWNWSPPVLISPEGTDDKDAAIFPRKFGGKYAVLHRLGISIWIDYLDSLDGKRPLDGKILMGPRETVVDSRKIGIAGPPIETPDGWLLIYHGISKNENHHYHLRAALLDLKDPTKVLARTKYPIFEPDMMYERYGLVPNVVFSNGAALVDDTLYVYYGGADTVVGVATVSMSALIAKLKSEEK